MRLSFIVIILRIIGVAVELISLEFLLTFMAEKLRHFLDLFQII
jgi:hypothetical protein